MRQEKATAKELNAGRGDRDKKSELVVPRGGTLDGFAFKKAQTALKRANICEEEARLWTKTFGKRLPKTQIRRGGKNRDRKPKGKRLARRALPRTVRG